MVDATTILLVEDNPLMRETLCDILHVFHPDWRVMTASNGLEGVEVARRNRPDLIVLDLHMPVMNGGSEIEFFRLARHGETVKLKARYASITEKETSKGPIILIVSETDYLTGEGELLARQRHTRKQHSNLAQRIEFLRRSGATPRAHKMGHRPCMAPRDGVHRRSDQHSVSESFSDLRADRARLHLREERTSS